MANLTDRQKLLLTWALNEFEHSVDQGYYDTGTDGMASNEGVKSEEIHGLRHTLLSSFSNNYEV